jgi:outer membrane protein OmpA-like peptidoglycan-associated protein
LSHRIQPARLELCPHAARTVVALALSVGTGASALAQGVENVPSYSIDVEMMRPTFGSGSLLGVDMPLVRKPRTFRAGLYVQYEDDPLTVYDAVNDVELGSAIETTVNPVLGVSYDLSDRVTLGAVLPAVYNDGPVIANGSVFAIGDIGVNARAVFLKTRRDVFNMGVRAGLVFPSGADNAFVGDSSVRVSTGLLAMGNAGPLRLGTDVGIITREAVVTGEDFQASTEVTWGNGLTLFMPAATRTALTGQVVARSGLQNFLAGGAENALEAMGGLQFYPSQTVTVDLGAGRGLTEGYGTTDLRIMGGLIVEIAPKEPLALPTPPPPPPPLPPEPPPPELVFDDPPVVEETEISVVYEDRIELKQQIEFVVGTNVIQDYSLPIVDDIANIINNKANIGHVTIIGHASKEGTFEYNYKLSESRARAIWEKLIERGVSFRRISYQGSGEVRPVAGFEGESEEELQKNRRTEFQITQWYREPDEMPDYPSTQVIPWTGETVVVAQPPKPEPETEEEPEVEVDEYGLPIDDDEDSFEMEGTQPDEGEE